MTKSELRRKYPPVPDNGAAAASLIALWEAQGAPDSVFCYVSGADECDTFPILRYCLEHHVPLAVPLCEGRGIMTARVITDLSSLREGRFGLWEPPMDAEEMAAPAMAVVPGLAFDRDGYRLGRGGGYYDRWLAGRTCYPAGLCRGDRLLDEIPRDCWDIPVRRVITGPLTEGLNYAGNRT